MSVKKQKLHFVVYEIVLYYGWGLWMQSRRSHILRTVKASFS